MQEANAKSIPVYFINSFTTERFKGNPTAICVCWHPLNEMQMPLIAKELGLPVTAFVEIMEGSTSSFAIRYFTTTTEIPACGHATLAAGKLINMLTGLQQFQFKTGAGSLIDVAIADDLVRMEYPKHKVEYFNVSDEMMKSLSLEKFTCLGYASSLETLFIEVADIESLEKIKPDFSRLIGSSDMIKEVVVTTIGTGKYDYVLRSFCPWIGIDEDPVTGSVQPVLAIHWGKKFSKNKLCAYQASERGGEIFLQVLPDSVEVSGQAVLAMKGEFFL